MSEGFEKWWQYMCLPDNWEHKGLCRGAYYAGMREAAEICNHEYTASDCNYAIENAIEKAIPTTLEVEEPPPAKYNEE